MDDKIKCVYKLKCRDTNITEFYIGSSIDFKRRKKEHKSDSNNLNKGHSYCLPLYMFINVNGGFDNWMFEIIKEYNFISKKELEINEQAYKDLLKPHLNSNNAYGIDKERKKNYTKKQNKIHSKIKENCPHCNKEMLKKSIKSHISRKH